MSWGLRGPEHGEAGRRGASGQRRGKEGSSPYRRGGGLAASVCVGDFFSAWRGTCLWGFCSGDPLVVQNCLDCIEVQKMSPCLEDSSLSPIFMTSHNALKK